MTARMLQRLATAAAAIAGTADEEELLAALLGEAALLTGVEHAMVLLLDEAGERLFTVASSGYTLSGVGSEVGLGEGILGMAAKSRTPIRHGGLGTQLRYARMARRQSERARDSRLTREIELPGLSDVQSVLAVPLLAGEELLGVVGVESRAPAAFDGLCQDALVTLSIVAAQKLVLLRALLDEDGHESPRPTASVAPAGANLSVRYYPEDDSVFVDREYVIKGLAGRILWKLLSEHARSGRSEFSNRELRLDSSLELSVIKDNLESRLILLRRRLEDKDCGIRLERRGRGRFALLLDCPVELSC